MVRPADRRRSTPPHWTARLLPRRPGSETAVLCPGIPRQRDQSSFRSSRRIPLHKARVGDHCSWNPNPRSVARGGYDFGGWAHFKKSSPCFLRWYGWRAGTLFNLTLNHPPKSKAWWGRGTTRDVITLLLREKLLYTSWKDDEHGITLSYLWKVRRSPLRSQQMRQLIPFAALIGIIASLQGVIRTSGSYKAQHARHIAQAVACGRAPASCT